MKYSKNFTHALTVEKIDLKNIATLLQESGGEITIEVECSDGIVRDFDNDIEKLLSYENIKSEQIRKISMSADSGYLSNPDGSRKSLSVNLADDYYTRRASVTIDGSENFVTLYRSKIEKHIKEMKPWYSFLSRIGYEFLPIMIIVPVYAYNRIFYNLYHYDVDKEKVENISIFILIAVVILSLFFVFIKYTCPKVSFLIGKGENRYKFKEKLRWFIIPSPFVILGTLVRLFF